MEGKYTVDVLEGIFRETGMVTGMHWKNLEKTNGTLALGSEKPQDRHFASHLDQDKVHLW